MTPEEDAVVIREHCRLREKIMMLTVVNHHGTYCVSREAVLKLLQLPEPDRKPRLIVGD